MSRRRRRRPRDPNKPKRSKYSWLCYRPESSDRSVSCSSYERAELFMEKYHLTRKNIVSLIEPGKRFLYVKWHRHRYYLGIHSDCLEHFKHYCLYERKNHPAKKGKNRMLTSYAEMDEYNRVMYPFWLD